jgi:hypothetical protein
MYAVSDPEDKFAKVDLRQERTIICGDHGVGRGYNSCPKCGGFAIPAINHQLLAKARKQA